jgi:selenoprotein W-related protein
MPEMNSAKTVIIEYCPVSGYLGRAASLAEQILRTHANAVSEVKLLPSSDGAFEISVDGTLIHSRKATGRHISPNDVLAALR